ncbi:MAG: ATP-dependent RecD-like DNA helicase [Oscillospiraceae bacterium]|nr:ATP-dependent RecD-like DNA helicase [Oscillospiraceae bacterium]
METYKNFICLSGNVEGIVFYNEDNGYIVLDLDVDGELVEAVGIMGDVREGECLTVYGEYVNNSKYGRQFSVDIFERRLPTDLRMLQKYLASGILSGVGSVLAKKIVDAFGEKTADILENDPVQLSALKGVTAERAFLIGKEYQSISGIRKALTYFSKYSVSYGFISAAWKKYGSDLIRAVEGNPYCLCGWGIDLPFAEADRIAEDLNFPKNSEERVSAGILHELRKAVNDGHTCIKEALLRDRLTTWLMVSEDLYVSALEFLEASGEITCYESGSEPPAKYVFLSEYFRAESFIAKKLCEMIKRSKNENTDFSEEINGISWECGIEYDEVQTAAINGCMNNHVFIITGGPGTGKTTTLNAVIELCKKRRLSIKLCAPTGRAAKRIADLTESPAQTIHRLLEADFSTGENVFRRNEENPLSCDVLIVDEMSMVDAVLFASLLRAVKSSTRLILVGDSDQLPSVSAGNILRDLVSLGRVPKTGLTKIFRQAAQSLIVTNAHAIIRGEMPELNDRKNDFFFMRSESEENTMRLVCDLCAARLPKSYGYDPIGEIQVLCLSRMGAVGTMKLNSELQRALNPAASDKREVKFINTLFREGDKIMQNKNDYDVEWRRGNEKSHGVYNGDIGTIIEADRLNMRLLIDFDGRRAVYEGDMLKNIEHAFAMTVHKSQGSEYPAVIIPLPNGMEKLSYRNILYTAVTRAKSTLIVIGTENKISAMLLNDRRNERVSCLKALIEDNMGDISKDSTEDSFG